MFSSPYPAAIAFVSLTIADGDFERLPAEERGLLSEGASVKRRAQFANGRLACRAAFEQLGISPCPPVFMGARGEPLWPAGLTGTITHCEDYAAVALARTADAAALGLDVERCDRELRHDISKRVCQAREIAWAEEGGAKFSARIIALFSAKESIYKAVYHLTGQPYRFKQMLLSPAAGGFHGQLETAVGSLPQGFEFEVGCAEADGYVFTSVLFR